MAPNETKLEVLVGVKGTEKLRGLTSSLKRLTNTTKLTSQESKKLRDNIRSQFAESKKSINGNRALASSYRELARNVDMTSREFREATREANKLDRQLAKMQKRNKRGIGGRMGGLARTAGAMGAAGIFGGAEGFAGAAIGGLFGGAAGAAVGGAAGAVVGNVRQSLGEIATYNASLKQQQLALQLVVKDTEKYNSAQEFLSKTSKDLAIPQDVIVRQFTQLTASVTGAGKSVEDAQEVFLSIASGIRGTGGSLEDMRSAMVATSQVFSKGKVSAEELRQQLGERLPGAFTLFAASMDKTPAELDKALEQGKVTLDDFMGFAKHLFANYGENAKILADSPAAAGDRLATEFSKLKENFGGLFTTVGAIFQDFTTKILKFLNNNQERVKGFITNIANFFIGGFNVLKKVVVDVFNFVKKLVIGIIEKIQDAMNAVNQFLNKSISAFNTTVNKLKNIPLLGNVFKDFEDIGQVNLQDTLSEGFKNLGIYAIGGEENLNKIKEYGDELAEVFKNSKKLTSPELFEPFKAYTDLINKTTQATKKLTKATGDLKDKGSETFSSLKEGLKGYYDSIKDFGKQFSDATVNALKGMEDAFVKFALTGKLSFRDMTRSILADLTRIYVRKAMVNTLGSIFPFLANAKGNAFNQGLVKKYAKGGVVSEPTFFKYGSGGSGKFGLMGEAGSPEAILPLKRGRSGNLGVESSGNASNNIVVNVDASGTEVQGNNESSNQLGKLVGLAVQQELVKQQRPGGILSPT